MEIIAYTELTAAFEENLENLVINPLEQISDNLLRLAKELRMVINQPFLFAARCVTYGFIFLRANIFHIIQPVQKLIHHVYFNRNAKPMHESKDISISKKLLYAVNELAGRARSKLQLQRLQTPFFSV